MDTMHDPKSQHTQSSWGSFLVWNEVSRSWISWIFSHCNSCDVHVALVGKKESMTTYYDKYNPPIIISWPVAFL